MPSLSLTDLVDIAAAAGTPKANKIKSIKQRGPYQPWADFYRAVRLHIVQVHQGGLPRARLKDVLQNVQDKKKLIAYPAVVAGYSKWWGRKQVTWSTPPSAEYSAHGVDVRVNPEVGLSWNGTPHLVKLYFKRDPLTKNRSDLIIHLMQTALAGLVQPGTEMNVLDVRRSKLFSPANLQPVLPAMLQAELAYIANLWPNL